MNMMHRQKTANQDVRDISKLSVFSVSDKLKKTFQLNITSLAEIIDLLRKGYTIFS